MKGSQSNLEEGQCGRRRERIHELLIALIHKQDSFSLMDDENPIAQSKNRFSGSQDPAEWLDRNRRVLKSYQALVRSAVTLDALLDAGIVTQNSERKVLEINRAVNYTDYYRDIDIHVIPSDRFRVTFLVE